MKRINVTKTFLPPKEEYDSMIAEAWESAWITNHGPLVTQLENRLREYFGIDYFLFLNNGTSALQVAIKALELKGKVITTPFSYVATTSSLVWENCEPVFADIDEHTFNIDPENIERLISDDVSAIMATHVFGNPCQVEQIQAIANKHDIPIIYDAAHCFGTKYKGESVLKWGDISTLSFHATKIFHTVEGGGVISNTNDLHHKLSYLRNFGHNGPEHFWGLGINGKNSEFHAAMGLCLLNHLDTIFSQRKERHEFYKKHILSNDIVYQHIGDNVDYNYAYFPIVFPDAKSREEVQANLSEGNIISRRYFYPSLNQLPYIQDVEMPNSEFIADRILCLPFYPDLEFNDMERIITIINQSLS